MELFEVCNFRSQLLESAPAEQGVLATVRGIFAVYDQVNRNGRYYPKALWERVLSSESVKDNIKNKRMYGELDHPDTRIESKLEQTAFCITNLWLDAANKCVMGEAKVLDTPTGRIMNTLLRFGSVIGMSSRAVGDVVEKSGYKEVVPETYEFITFDAVTDPSNVGAYAGLEESFVVRNRASFRDAMTNLVESADYKQLDTVEEFVVDVKNESDRDYVQDKIRDRRNNLLEIRLSDLENRIRVLEDKKLQNNNSVKDIDNFTKIDSRPPIEGVEATVHDNDDSSEFLSKLIKKMK